MKNEIWESVEGFNGYYAVSNRGRVKSIARTVNHAKNGSKRIRERILKPSSNERGYLTVVLYKNGNRKTYKIHQLIATAFLGHTPNGMKSTIDHVNGIKTDNRLENLQIVSHRENIAKGYGAKQTTSNYRGVTFDNTNGKWKVQIQLNGKVFHLGYYHTEKRASLAYKLAVGLIRIENSFTKSDADYIKHLASNYGASNQTTLFHLPPINKPSFSEMIMEAKEINRISA